MVSRLFLLLSVVAIRSDDDESNKGNIFPQLSFQRTLYADDVYSSAYCLETGEPGGIQGKDPTMGYEVFQACFHGRIDISLASLWLSNTKSGAYSDLGTIQDIAMRYDLKSLSYGTIYESIHWDTNFNGSGLVISKVVSSSSTTLQALSAMDTANLSTVSNALYVTPKTGHVYLVRLCGEGCAGTWDQTELYYKFIALNAESPFTIRWNVFYTNFEVPREDEDEGLLSSDDRAKAALGLSITVFIFFVLGLIYLIWRRQNAGKVDKELGHVNTSSEYENM